MKNHWLDKWENEQDEKIYSCEKRAFYEKSLKNLENEKDVLNKELTKIETEISSIMKILNFWGL